MMIFTHLYNYDKIHSCIYLSMLCLFSFVSADSIIVGV